MLTTASEYLGSFGNAMFAQSGGTHTVGGNLYLGYFAGSGGTYSLTGNSVLSASAEYVGYAAPVAAVFQQSGATTARCCCRSATAQAIH